MVVYNVTKVSSWSRTNIRLHLTQIEVTGQTRKAVPTLASNFELILV